MEVVNSEPKTRRHSPRNTKTKKRKAKVVKTLAALPHDTDRLLRLDAVLELTTMSRAWAYDAIRKGKFPPGVKLSDRARVWPVSSIIGWIEERKAAA